MFNELVEKLKQAEAALSASRQIGVNKLESLNDDLKLAFNRAIESLAGKTNLLGELKLRREKLKYWRIGVLKTIWPVNLKYLASSPFIYSMFFPVLLTHICLEIYHQVCFRLYGIPLVDSKQFFIYDRQLLPYLNWLEKFNCIYCSYVNNFFRYAVEIGGRTERYWCPIKYHRRIDNTHSQYPKFVEYFDGENFRDKWRELRDFSDLEADSKGQPPA